MKDAKVITAIMDYIYIYYIDFIEQIQKQHEEDQMNMMQETCKMIEEQKEYLDKKRAEWEIERKHLKENQKIGKNLNANGGHGIKLSAGLFN